MDLLKTKLFSHLRKQDPRVFEIIKRDEMRQREYLNMIASENYTPPAVLEALGSCLSNKYSHSYPGTREYPGGTHIDEIENLCIERALKCFRLDPSEWGANVQAFSGSIANLAVFSAILKNNNRLIALDVNAGGHPSHGFYTQKTNENIVSRFFKPLFYGLNPKTQKIDYENLDKIARAYLPRLIVTGASSYPRDIDYERISKTAKSVGAMLMVDMAHTSGLIASELLNNPFNYADIVTTTTHKTLNGPRGAIIFFRKELADEINFGVYPHLQPGGPQNNKTAAIAVQLGKVCSPEFKKYSQQIISNSKTLANSLIKKGYTIATGGTDTHLFIWNCGASGVSGDIYEKISEKANILLSKTSVYGQNTPLRNNSELQGGLRIGTPALTARGMKEKEMQEVASLMDEVFQICLGLQRYFGVKFLAATVKEKDFLCSDLDHGILKLKKKVKQFSSKFPTPGIEETLEGENYIRGSNK